MRFKSKIDSYYNLQIVDFQNYKINTNEGNINQRTPPLVGNDFNYTLHIFSILVGF